MDYGNAQARHLIVGHHLLDREWISALAIGQLRTFDFCEHEEQSPSERLRNLASGRGRTLFQPAAKALGLTAPSLMLAQANEVPERVMVLRTATRTMDDDCS